MEACAFLKADGVLSRTPTGGGGARPAQQPDESKFSAPTGLPSRPPPRTRRWLDVSVSLCSVSPASVLFFGSQGLDFPEIGGGERPNPKPLLPALTLTLTSEPVNLSILKFPQNFTSHSATILKSQTGKQGADVDGVAPSTDVTAGFGDPSRSVPQRTGGAQIFGSFEQLPPGGLGDGGKEPKDIYD